MTDDLAGFHYRRPLKADGGKFCEYGHFLAKLQFKD